MSKAVPATRPGRGTRCLCLLRRPGRPRRPVALLPVSTVIALISSMVRAAQAHWAALHDQGQSPGQGMGHTPPGFGQQSAEGGRGDLHLPGGLFLRQSFGICQAQGFQHVQAQSHGGGVASCFRKETSATGLGSDAA